MKNILTIIALLSSILCSSQNEEIVDDITIEETTTQWLSRGTNNSNNSQDGNKDNGQGQHNGVTDNYGNHYGWENSPPQAPIDCVTYPLMFGGVILGWVLLKNLNQK